MLRSAARRTVLAPFSAHGSPVNLTAHLSPFALYAAFPRSDYYEDSVAMRPAAFRPSHVPTNATYQTDLGVPFAPLTLLPKRVPEQLRSGRTFVIQPYVRGAGISRISCRPLFRPSGARLQAV